MVSPQDVGRGGGPGAEGRLLSATAPQLFTPRHPLSHHLSPGTPSATVPGCQGWEECLEHLQGAIGIHFVIWLHQGLRQ